MRSKTLPGGPSRWVMRRFWEETLTINSSSALFCFYFLEKSSVIL